MNQPGEANPIPESGASERRLELEAAEATPAARTGTLVERVLALRDPLCRAELAASRITSDAWSAPHELAREIRAAISEIDERIDAVVASLRRPKAPDQTREDAHAVAASVLERMLPVLEARAVHARLLACSEPGTAPLTTRDPAVLRRAVLVALRVAIATLPHGGQLALELIDGECLGLRMRRFAAGPASASERDAVPRQRALARPAERREREGTLDARKAPLTGALEPLHSMAAGIGGWVDVQPDAESALPALCLWLGGAARPAASPHSEATR